MSLYQPIILTLLQLPTHHTHPHTHTHNIHKHMHAHTFYLTRSLASINVAG